MMTREELYEFDLNGYIIWRSVLAPDYVRKLNEIIDTDLAGEFPRVLRFMDKHPVFLELMEQPFMLGKLRSMIGNWFRYDHAYGLQMTTDTEINENLHGGARTDQGEHQYQWVGNRLWNGLVVVMFALEEVRSSDGGFIVVPGSHKSHDVDYIPDVYSPLVVNPALKPGDMLIFTEALVHGTRKWVSPHRRRSLLYKYSPGFSAWRPYEEVAPLLPLAANDMQRALLRPPYVGQRPTREPLPFAD